MKQKLFNDIADRENLLASLEADCVDIEENYQYVKPFTRREKAEADVELSKSMVNKSRLKHKIDTLMAPYKEELKGIDAVIKTTVNNLDQGGETTHGTVYCFPDYQLNLMGLYDDDGNLVGTRPLNREERQLHINSNLNRARDEAN